MMDQDELARRKELDRAAKAAAILDSPLLKEAIESIRQHQRDFWIRTKPSQVDEREAAYWSLRVVDMIEAALQSHVTTGKLAAQSLREKTEELARDRRTGRRI